MTIGSALIQAHISKYSATVTKWWQGDLPLLHTFLFLIHGLLFIAHLPRLVWIIALAKFLPLGESVGDILATTNNTYGQKHPGNWGGPIPEDFSLLLYCFDIVVIVFGGLFLQKFVPTSLHREHRAYVFWLGLAFLLIAILYTFPA